MSPNGDAQISYSYSDIKVVDDGSLGTAELEQLESAYAPLASVTGTGRLTARNQVFDSTIAGTDGFDPTVAQAMSQVSAQVGSVSLPFPAEPVGDRRALARCVIGVRQAVSTCVSRTSTPCGNATRTASCWTSNTRRPRRGSAPNYPACRRARRSRSRSSEFPEPVRRRSACRTFCPSRAERRAAGVQIFSVRAEGEQGTLTQKLAVEMTVSRPPGEAQA